jgi:hypothetical protein
VNILFQEAAPTPPSSIDAILDSNTSGLTCPSRFNTRSVENSPVPCNTPDTESSISASSDSTELWDNPAHIGAALSLIYDKTTHIQEPQTLMFAQMNALGLNMSHYLTSSTPPTATEVQCSCPIIVSTMEGDEPPVEDTVAFEVWKEEMLNRGEREMREKGYDGSFVLAGVRPARGSEGIAKPGHPMADGGRGRSKEKAKYQATVTDEEDEITLGEEASTTAESSQATPTLGVPHYVSVTEDGNYPPVEDTVAFIEWAQARMDRKKAALRAAGVEGDAVLLDCFLEPRRESGAGS